jgi:squalene-hopene/tetraprenyl-beta-curcumene cyclase
VRQTPRPARPFVPILVMFAIAAVTFAAAAPPAWDAGSAAKYLDARMDAWWTNAKVLKTGDTEARCISCHTVVPYVLARPALRRTLGQTTPTPHEARILDTVRSRVRSLNNQQPYYDHTEDKKIESRGVEAVLNALVLTSDDAEARAAQPGTETRAAMARLWEVQRQDGAWDWLNFGLEPYETPDAVFYGAALAALAAGSAPGMAASKTDAGTAGRDRLARYLSTQLPSQRLFNRTWALLAASRMPEALTREQRASIVGDLEAAQRADGGWALNDLGTWRWDKTAPPFTGPGKTDSWLLSVADGYATGLATFALRQSGAGAIPAVVKGQQWLRSHQSTGAAGDPSWAPWRAHSLNFDREHGGPKGEPWRRMFMSDLATAFATLALVE